MGREYRRQAGICDMTTQLKGIFIFLLVVDMVVWSVEDSL